MVGRFFLGALVRVLFCSGEQRMDMQWLGYTLEVVSVVIWAKTYGVEFSYLGCC